VIREIRRATDEEWDAMVDSAESAVYFQTREWFDIWAGYGGFGNDAKLIEFESGKKVLLPLARLKLLKGLITGHFLSPKGMGGFVTNDALDDDEKKELFGVLKKEAMLFFAANPYDKLTNEFDGFTGEDFTQVLDLGAGFEAIFRNWSKGHSSAAKRGMREGVFVETGRTEDDWKSYFRVYQDSLERWGDEATNAYKWNLFEKMKRMQSSKIRLWLARYQGRTISGALCFYHNKHVAYWHSATLTEALNLKGPHVLQYHIIQDACDKGFLYYDFLPSSGLEGVEHFKSGFSPQRKPVHIYMSPLMRLSDAMRERFRNNPIYKVIMKDTGF
jgi:lipid II:glycine glycyltransferase (peptidoglycan interpeptide bridge formation enzyme)